MKKLIIILLAAVIVICVTACSAKTPEIKATFEKTAEVDYSEPLSGETVRRVTYYEMTDGTYKANDIVYKYKLTLEDVMPNSDTKVKYVVLSNNKDITFDEAFMSSGFGSDLNDYFKPEEAVIVEYTVG